MPTPWPESHEDTRVPSALKRSAPTADDDAEEMGIDAELETTPKAKEQQSEPQRQAPPVTIAPTQSSPPRVKQPVVPMTPTGRRKSRRQTRDPELLAEEAAAATQGDELGEPQPVPVSPEDEKTDLTEASQHPPETPARKRQRKSHGDIGAEPEEAEVEQPTTAPPVTPRRASRGRAVTPARTPAEVLAEPPVPIADAEEAQFGKYYEALVRTLKINAIDRGLRRLR